MNQAPKGTSVKMPWSGMPVASPWSKRRILAVDCLGSNRIGHATLLDVVSALLDALPHAALGAAIAEVPDPPTSSAAAAAVLATARTSFMMFPV